jgi:hypothetical protein
MVADRSVAADHSVAAGRSVAADHFVAADHSVAADSAAEGSVDSGAVFAAATDSSSVSAIRLGIGPAATVGTIPIITIPITTDMVTRILTDITRIRRLTMGRTRTTLLQPIKA